MRTRQIIRTVLPVILAALIVVLGAFLVFGCPGGNGKKNEDRPAVATISMPQRGVQVRLAGELEFKPWKEGQGLPGGTTLRTGMNEIVVLLFMRNIQVQLGKTTPSELILEGAVQEGQGKAYVLGLKEGVVWVHSYADEPVVVKMPHAEVRGRGSYFTVSLKRMENGKYVADINAQSLNITVTNAFGTLEMTEFGTIRVDETEPPVVLRKIPSRRH
jgi:hypothetical protein